MNIGLLLNEEIPSCMECFIEAQPQNSYTKTVHMYSFLAAQSESFPENIY